jgi:hypothetical protein
VVVLAVIGGVVGTASEHAEATSTVKASIERRVLLAGDSLTAWQGRLPENLRAARGMRGTVVNAAVGSTTPCSPQPLDWSTRLAGLLALHRPDTVVFEFVGHEPTGGPWVDCVLGLIDMVEDAEVYFVVPPISGAWWCQWDHPETDKIARHAAWIRDELPTLRPEVELIDWRSRLSANERYDPRYRDNADCVHLNDAGEQVAAELTIDEIWTRRRASA